MRPLHVIYVRALSPLSLLLHTQTLRPIFNMEIETHTQIYVRIDTTQVSPSYHTLN